MEEETNQDVTLSSWVEIVSMMSVMVFFAIVLGFLAVL